MSILGYIYKQRVREHQRATVRDRQTDIRERVRDRESQRQREKERQRQTDVYFK